MADTVEQREQGERVPQGLRTLAGWSWRILAVLAMVVVLVFVAARLEVIFVALFVALLATALLDPAARRLRAWGVPHALATGLVLVGALVVLSLLLYFVARSVLGQVDEFRSALTDGIEKVRGWLDTTFGISLEELWDRLRSLAENLGGEGAGGLTSSAFGFASTAVEIVAGAGISLFATIFFVHEGPRIWSWVTSLFPAGTRSRVDEAGRLSWHTLAAYARGTVIIAAIDAIGIGLGVLLVGVPLAGPIAVLVFFGAFIPIVGALVSGFVAVVIALATQGLTAALIVLAVVIGVQQVEGHILQPLIQGRMVALHPLAVVLAVAAGSTIAGLVGAVIAVPIVATLNVLIRYVARGYTGDPGTDDAAAAADGAEPPGEVTAPARSTRSEGRPLTPPGST